MNFPDAGKHLRARIAAAAMIAMCASLPAAALAQESANSSDSALTYADAVDLAEAAPLVVLAEIRRTATLKPERTGPVRAGWARLYIEAETRGLLAGTVPVGEELAYLADVPLDARGRVPKLKKTQVLLFARPVPGRAGELQLVAPDAQIAATHFALERTRAILTELVDPAGPPQVSGVRDLLHTPGNLAGEGETQIFLDTEDGVAASITVRRRPGQPAQWGLSTGELVDLDARPPAPGSLGWYRLACSLPATLPAGAHLSPDPEMRRRAEVDYATVIADLGTCDRNRVF